MDISTLVQVGRITKKPKGPQPSTSTHRKTIKKLAPPLPARPSSSSHPTTRANGTHPTLPIKTLQGRKTKRTDTTKDGWDRDVVFVNRHTPLGALMGRCRSLIMDEGYVCIRNELIAGIHVYDYMLYQLLYPMPCCYYMLCWIYYHAPKGIKGCGTRSERGVRNV